MMKSKEKYLQICIVDGELYWDWVLKAMDEYAQDKVNESIKPDTILKTCQIHAQSLAKEVVEGLTESNLNEPIWDKDYDTIVATRKDAIELIKAKFQL